MLSYDQSVRAFGYFIVCQENTAFGYALFLWDIFIELSKSVTVLTECTTNFISEQLLALQVIILCRISQSFI